MDNEILQMILNEVKGIKIDVSSLKDGQQRLENEIIGMKTDINELKSDVNNMKSDINELKSDVNELKSDVNNMKSDINELKSDVNNMKSDINELKVGQERIEMKLDAVYEQTADLTEFKTETTEKSDVMNDKLVKLSNDFNVLEVVTGKNMQDIAHLKAII